jgi:glutaconate CoA-transferase, subunit B
MRKLPAGSAREVIMVLGQKPRTVVEEVDLVNPVGHCHDGQSRKELGYPGAGPTVVITDLGVLRPDPEIKELTLVAMHPGASVGHAREATGWELRVAEELGTTDPPTEEELRTPYKLHARIAAARKGAVE